MENAVGSLDLHELQLHGSEEVQVKVAGSGKWLKLSPPIPPTSWLVWSSQMWRKLISW